MIGYTRTNLALSLLYRYQHIHVRVCTCLIFESVVLVYCYMFRILRQIK